MLSIKQAKAFLIFAFAPSLSLKATDLVVQPMFFGVSTLLAKPLGATQHFFRADKQKKGSPSEDDGHPLHEEEESDSYVMLRNKNLGDRKRSRKESE